MDLLKPDYNINPIAGSRLGSIHSEETRENLRKALLGRSPFFF